MSRARSRAERRAAARAATRNRAVPRAASWWASPASAMGRRIITAMLAILLLVTALYAATNPVIGSDLWFALASGRYISEHHVVPSVDVFSYTHEGRPWFNQEWLAQMMLYQAFRIVGGDGIVAVKLAAVTMLVLLMAWIGWRRSGSAALGVLTAVAGAVVCRPYLDIRPHIFTLLATLILVAVTDAYRRRPRTGLLAGVPLLLMVWVNLHYGFIYGLGALGLIAGVETARAFLSSSAPLSRRQALALDAAAAAAVVACLLNPQHLRALTFPFTILGEASPWKDVLEWKPVVLFADEAFNPILFSYFFLAQLAALAAALWRAPHRIDLAALALAAVTAVMAFQARRFVPLFVVVSTPLLAANLALACEPVTVASAGAGAPRSLRATVATGLAVLLTLAWIGWKCVDVALPVLSDGLFDGMIVSRYFPRAAVEFLRSNPLPARLYNLYNWGGYLMYMLPARKVFIDGRAHEVYPSSFYYENISVHFAHADWEAVLDRYEVSVILWPSHENAEDTDLAALLAALDASPHWRRIYEDEQAAVFAHVERGRLWVEGFEEGLVYPEGGGPAGREPAGDVDTL